MSENIRKRHFELLEIIKFIEHLDNPRSALYKLHKNFSKKLFQYLNYIILLRPIIVLFKKTELNDQLQHINSSLLGFRPESYCMPRPRRGC
jgi:hypothetical protein